MPNISVISISSFLIVTLTYNHKQKINDRPIIFHIFLRSDFIWSIISDFLSCAPYECKGSIAEWLHVDTLLYLIFKQTHFPFSPIHLNWYLIITASPSWLASDMKSRIEWFEIYPTLAFISLSSTSRPLNNQCSTFLLLGLRR